jgi:hypothetical protein
MLMLFLFATSVELRSPNVDVVPVFAHRAVAAAATAY